MTEAIEARYRELAESECCLSCGGAAAACDPNPGETCVDLGCGRGTDVLRLAEAVGPTGRVYGIDVTDEMLAKARRTAEKLGVTNAIFLRSTFEHIALRDESTHWVVSNCALNHADDKAAAWREIARILKPGGRFIVSDIYALEDIAEEDRSDPEAVAECWAGAVRKDEYLGHIAEAGLIDVQLLEESQPYVKGKAVVASFTVAGKRRRGGCCCS